MSWLNEDGNGMSVDWIIYRIAGLKVGITEKKIKIHNIWKRLPYYEFAEFNGMDLARIHGLPDIFHIVLYEGYSYYGKIKIHSISNKFQ